MKRVGVLGLMLAICLQFTSLSGQSAKHVLFLGNSYTAANNLPQMIADAALSTGDTVIFDQNLPGGYTFQMHATNASTLGKIAQGGWDYVVLQEQSQRPSFPLSQVLTEVFPFAAQLNQSIKQHNPCAETVFYMTWGRKNGDASNCQAWPPVCTYAGMDSLLRLRYMMLADSNNAIVSPVGALWRHISTVYPDIELYEADESHPSFAGSYAAACAFYTTILRKDPTLITWSGSLDPSIADRIKLAARAVVFDSLSTWFVGTYEPEASFSFIPPQAAQVDFINQSVNASQYYWDFGDGNSSTLENPVHVYQSNGQYTVTLVASHCGQSDTATQQVQISFIGLDSAPKQPGVIMYPNPTEGVLFITPTPGDPICRVIVQTVNGIHIRSFEHHGNETLSVDLSNFSAGIYLIRIESEHGVTIRKVILGMVIQN
jgi:uncharacterized membrane protein